MGNIIYNHTNKQNNKLTTGAKYYNSKYTNSSFGYSTPDNLRILSKKEFTSNCIDGWFIYEIEKHRIIDVMEKFLFSFISSEFFNTYNIEFSNSPELKSIKDIKDIKMFFSKRLDNEENSNFINTFTLSLIIKDSNDKIYYFYEDGNGSSYYIKNDILFQEISNTLGYASAANYRWLSPWDFNGFYSFSNLLNEIIGQTPGAKEIKILSKNLLCEFLNNEKLTNDYLSVYPVELTTELEFIDNFKKYGEMFFTEDLHECIKKLISIRNFNTILDKF